jgi:hypothetical protein
VGIPDYIASIDRATRALAGLQSSPLQTNQKAISELSALLRFGAKQLEQVFKDILREESGRIEPMQFMAKGVQISSSGRASLYANGQQASHFQRYRTATAICYDRFTHMSPRRLRKPHSQILSNHRR